MGAPALAGVAHRPDGRQAPAGIVTHEPVGPAASTPPSVRRRPRHPPSVAQQAATDMLWITWMTSHRDRLDHAVTDEVAAAGVRGGGRYRAVCGHLVTPQALASPSGPACPRCRAHLDQRHPTPARRSVAGWMRRPLALFAALRGAE